MLVIGGRTAVGFGLRVVIHAEVDAAVVVKLIFMGVGHQIALTNIGAKGIIVLLHLPLRDGIAPVRVIAVGVDPVAHAVVGGEMLRLLADTPETVIAVAGGKRPVALQIQAYLLGEKAVEEVIGYRRGVLVLAQGYKDFAGLGVILLAQQAQPLLIAGLLCQLRAVLVIAQLQISLTGVVPALVLQKLSRPLIGGDLRVGLLRLCRHLGGVPEIAELVKAHGGVGIFADAVQALGFLVNHRPTGGEFVDAQGNARNQQHRQQHI